MVQLTPLAVSVDLEVVGFDSEEQRRWREVAVKRRETGFGGGEADFGVVFDSSGAEEECVSVVPAVKEEEFVVLSSHPAQRNYMYLGWGLANTPAGVLCKLTDTCTS